MAATQQQRNELCLLMDWLQARRDRVHYPPVLHGVIERTVRVSQLGIRSIADVMRLVERPGGLTLDCSQMGIVLLLAVGLPVSVIDGATSTLLNDPKLRHFADARLSLPGGLHIYGGGGGHHLTMTRHADRVHGNPVEFSHGQESDPRYLSLLLEAAHQPAPVTCLSIAGL